MQDNAIDKIVNACRCSSAGENARRTMAEFRESVCAVVTEDGMEDNAIDKIVEACRRSSAGENVRRTMVEFRESVCAAVTEDGMEGNVTDKIVDACRRSCSRQYLIRWVDHNRDHDEWLAGGGVEDTEAYHPNTSQSRDSAFFSLGNDWFSLLSSLHLFAEPYLALPVGLHGSSSLAEQVEHNAGYLEPEAVYFEPKAVYLEPEAVYLEPEAVYLEPEAVYLEPEAVHVYAECMTAYRQLQFSDLLVPSFFQNMFTYLQDLLIVFRLLYSDMTPSFSHAKYSCLIGLVSMNITMSNNVKHHCDVLNLSFRRSSMLKHDYHILIYCLFRHSLPGRYVLCWKDQGTIFGSLQYVHFPKSSFYQACELFYCFCDIFRTLYQHPVLLNFGVGPRSRSSEWPLGGAAKFSFLPSKVLPYVVDGHDNLGSDIVLKFITHVDSAGLGSYVVTKGFVHAQYPVQYLVCHLSVAAQKSVARQHGIKVPSHIVREDLPSLFEAHNCIACNTMYSVFAATSSRECLVKARMKSRYEQKKASKPCESVVTLEADAEYVLVDSCFPPTPLTPDLSRKIIAGFCRSTGPRFVEEEGCAVCGLLTPSYEMVPLKNIKCMLHVLKASGVTRIERSSPNSPVREFSGPVLDYQCKQVCESCRASIIVGKTPKMALANGMWLGDVPPVLKNLKFVEKLLVARVRRTLCYARITASGLSKLKAHVIAFQAPVEKVYDMLPPPVEDLDDVLAILFTGSCQPTEADLRRTPLLVRRKAVTDALEWLKLNHADYKDVGISYKNLESYPEDRPPVSVVFCNSTSSGSTEDPAVFDNSADDDAIDGDCPFVVHGLTGEEISVKSVEALKGIALKHWQSNGKALRVGHAEHPMSTFNEPSLYPQMFPWLFPYGLGGIGSCTSGLSEKAHKKNLLMYQDKCFQVDVEFPFVAFSHEQVKAASSSGFLAVRKKNFDDIATRLLTVNPSILENIAKRMATGEIVKPVTDDEKQCFQVVNDLDVVAGKVDGSGATKRYMRNEIWSLVAIQGAPSWYITLSPADLKHPICLYYADSKHTFQPSIPRSSDDAFRLIAKNPVAGARFFHFMVSAFIEHVLGVGADHPGLYGDTTAYYGTVEQQGRLTLHLHLLLWIRGGLSPDAARQKIMDVESDFQKSIVEYLESAYQGDFLSGTKAEVEAMVEAASKVSSYINPTQQMPEPPPEPCEKKCEECKLCKSLSTWWGKFCSTVDDLLLRSNIHTCTSTLNKNGTQKRNKEHKGCLDNIWGRCKGRFPRELFAQTEVDPVTGALNMKKSESWINTFSAPLTYLFRCNTDVTSLRSGTALKAIILYVTKYITKPMLKTYVAFDAVRSIFHKNTAVLGGSLPRQEKARSLMTKVVNSLSGKSEMGSPMICMYLLQNPDHYTNYIFEPLYWPSFVKEARKVWNTDQELEDDMITHPEKITIIKVRGAVVGLSNIYDYIYRSPELENMSLYEWAYRCKRVKPSANDKLFATNSNVSQTSQSGSVTLQFTKEHPLADTHATLCYPPLGKRIPNLTGGTLPRRDQGDREYYCSTMLTLFKPWRTGYDLRAVDTTWDQSFTEHVFSKVHLGIMNNMNLRYECLDARDDYHAQMKSGGVMFPMGSMFQDNDLIADLDQQVYGEGDPDADDIPDPVALNESLGKSELSRRSNMEMMSKIMNFVGWNTPSNVSSKHTHLNSEKITTSLTGSQWKSLVANKRAEILADRSCNLPPTAGIAHVKDCNTVDIVTKSFLECSFKSKAWEPMIQDVTKEFKLNVEQERAFRIVANHATDSRSDQLKMYMGGMGGTGKTQVLKALIKYFHIRQESHRLVVVAPTGTAASLLGGSTYHYMFGINDQSDASITQLAQIKSRLVGVDYVFFDEVSMLSCRDLYRIASRLAQITGELTIPFGGMNMLFAGDFAQLPPVIGGEHASLYSRTAGSNTTSLTDQEAAIGKSVWHQVTSVVILRQNMRQTTQTTQDSELRQALENMRYRACTPADITFLRSRVSSSIPGRSSISEPAFRNISIITALNVHKDAINIIGSDRFAHETNQSLVDFYSDDSISMRSSNEDAPTWKKHTKSVTIKKSISDSIQNCLWNQPPCSNSKHIAGKLSLCVGLPIIIRHNAATELCITNGQEGEVYGWQSAVGSRGQRTLDTLFVKLSSPPKDVYLDGLPVNVIPLMKSTVHTICQLPSDETISVSRSQIEISVNYAMTDYSSQGKTRPFNVVDLHNCRSHQSYYTALSRSASAAGTLILQGFDAGKITGKASGALRQEFRELEILDEITRLRYYGKLPKGMHDAERRNTLIMSFRKCKGENYMPESIHKAIRWNKSDPYLEPSQEDVPWKVINKMTFIATAVVLKSKTTYVAAKGSDLTNPFTMLASSKRKLKEEQLSEKNVMKKKKIKMQMRNTEDNGDILTGIYVAAKRSDMANSFTVIASSKRKLEEEQLSEKNVTKKRKTKTQMRNTEDNNTPTGTQWQNNSCAYDAVVTILHEVWKDNPVVRTADFRELNASYLGTMATLFYERSLGRNLSLEGIRDILRLKLSEKDSEIFPYGDYTSVHSLLDHLLTTAHPVTTISVSCRSGHSMNRVGMPVMSALIVVVERVGESLQDQVSNLHALSSSRCRECSRALLRSLTFLSNPLLVAFDVSSVFQIIDHSLEIIIADGRTVTYNLRGVIYYGEHHFTCRIVDISHNVWFHDGIATGSCLQSDGLLEQVDLLSCRSRNATVALYVRS